MVTCPFSSREKLPAHLATQADSTCFSSLHSHLVLLFPLLPNFHLSAGKALGGVRSASDTPKGVLPFLVLPQCRGTFACRLGGDVQTH